MPMPRRGAGDAWATAALVVFADECTMRRLSWLEPGFRHCFAAVQRNRHWIVCNPLSHFTDLDVVGDLPQAALIDWYRRHGYRIVATWAVTPPPVCAPLRPFTCVEAVKRVLGLRAPWVFTPRQLYRHLLTEQAARDVTRPY